MATTLGLDPRLPSSNLGEGTTFNTKQEITMEKRKKQDYTMLANYWADSICRDAPKDYRESIRKSIMEMELTIKNGRIVCKPKSE